jgi:hypothetical protein
MIRRSGKPGEGGGTDRQLEDEIDALFTLPLAEFTGARNTLAARLKKERRADDADRVKLLGKPSVSAWTVNQLYWEHRDAFDELIATGRRLRPVQKSRLAGKAAADMRDSLDARREALTHLSDLAEELLRDAGHNPTLDTMRRIVATLEAMSAYALLPDGPTPGRLTHDVDPPSFESLALLMSRPAEEVEPAPSRKSDRSASAARGKVTTAGEVRRIEEFRQKKIAAAKAALQEAKKSLTDARAKVQSLDAAHKKANAQVKEAEKHKRQAESLLEQATAAYDEAVSDAEAVADEVREASQAVDDAKHTVDDATKDLESLLRK